MQCNDPTGPNQNPPPQPQPQPHPTQCAQVRPLKPPEDPLTGTQIYVVVVSIATVALWCCNNLLAHVTGEMGVLAILPLSEWTGYY